ncbi:LPS translocon maturation chaperone LptM [Bradyrhizobium sp.]|uniref:LPS translocon maturation chaperone LptM n=1 Tax=Bradyrhizobium sp. TaxID=376 RepID=UPI003C752C84
MKRDHRLTSPGWALILLSLLALALGGCGRKSGLDLPPSAALPSQTAVEADSEAARANQPGVFNPGYGSDSAPAASKGRKKSFVLDPLLGN